MLELTGVRYQAGGVTILDDISVRFEPGRFNVILGPNGAGKSTLLKVAAGVLAPSAGKVRYEGRSVAEMPAESLARLRAVLSQRVELAFAMSVEEVVMMGRYPHFRRSPGAIDRRIVGDALALVGVSNRRTQPYGTLSGGERQKVHTARVLAQVWNDAADGSHKLLFLDEPTSNLDVHYQLHVLDIARAMLKRNCTVIAVLHDLNTAFAYGDSFLLLDGGRAVLQAAAIPREVIERVFRVRAIAPTESKQPFWRYAL